MQGYCAVRGKHQKVWRERWILTNSIKCQYPPLRLLNETRIAMYLCPSLLITPIYNNIHYPAVQLTSSFLISIVQAHFKLAPPSGLHKPTQPYSRWSFVEFPNSKRWSHLNWAAGDRVIIPSTLHRSTTFALHRYNLLPAQSMLTLGYSSFHGPPIECWYFNRACCLYIHNTAL